MRAQRLAATFAGLAAAASAGDDAAFRRRLRLGRSTIQIYLESFELEGGSPGLTARYVGDALDRFLHTLEMVPLPAGERILEIGANPYFFHVLLRRIFPAATIEGANFFDRNIFSTAIGTCTQTLRSATLDEEWTFSFPLFNLETVPLYPYPPASFDLVFFCETLEHLVVDPLQVLRKLRRVLAPGGHLVITLPNALRLANFACMLDGYNIFDLYHPETGVHGRHNREFTLAEMKVLLRQHGLDVVRAETRDRFDYTRVPMVAVDYSGPPVTLPRRRRELEALLAAAGGRTEDRGDNLYLVARRPVPPAGVSATPRARLAGPVEIPPPREGSPRVHAFLDLVEDDPRALRVLGWAFLGDERGTAEEWIELVLAAPGRCFAVPAERMERLDVTDRFALDRNDPGFSARVEKGLLPAGRYRLGVRLGGPGLAEGYCDFGTETEV